MSAPLPQNPVHPSAPDRPILDHLPTPILLLDAAGHVTVANAAAVQIFAPIDPVGLALKTLFGLVGVTGSGGDGPGVTRIGMADGRAFDLRSGPLPDGGTALVMTDMSQHVRDAQAATLDDLTGLIGRATLHSRLAVALSATAANGPQTAVLCVDLDRFKTVNDTLGHPIGDALLAKVAERLRNAVRKGDMVGRLGGDEFAIVQTGGDQPRAAERLAARVVDLVGRSYVVNGHLVNIGASVGIATAPGDGADADTLLKRADLALYRAKAEGRGTFHFYEGAMDAEMQSRRLLEIDLRRALALREFELAFQPLIDLETRAITGFEALLRWRHPERGLVAPADFIPLAEEIGLIVPIGEWVLRAACAQAAKWPDHVSVAVNLSPVQFRGGKLVEIVTSALANAGLPASRLELEITEGALLDSTDTVLTVLHGLRALGVRISMDDFGTGYSSLSYLQKFPFDKIKIDQSFVRGMDTSEDCRAIVRAVAGLGASLGMRTAAEGVETEEQYERVRRKGCHEVQGYLTGRPLAPADADALFIPSANPNAGTLP